MVQIPFTITKKEDIQGSERLNLEVQGWLKVSETGYSQLWPGRSVEVRDDQGRLHNCKVSLNQPSMRFEFDGNGYQDQPGFWNLRLDKVD